VNAELMQFRAFFRASERVVRARTLPEKLDVVAQGVVEAGLFRRCLVSVYHHDRSDAVFFGSAGVSPALLQEAGVRRLTRKGYLEFRDQGVPLGEDCYYIPARFLRGQSVVRSERSPDEFGTWDPDDMFVAYLVSTQGTYLGNLTADDPYDGNIPTPDSVRTLSLFAKLAADFLEREFELRRDSLTHLYNGTYLDEMLEQMAREGHAGVGVPPWALLFADLDGLKEVNDRFGHTVGDQFIRAAADLLQGALPETTLFFRPYGDEFVALADGRDIPDLERVESAIEESVAVWNRTERLALLGVPPGSEEADDPNTMLGLSAGLVRWEAGESPVAALQRAEHRMYRRKSAMYGRGARRRRGTPQETQPSGPTPDTGRSSPVGSGA